MNEFDARLPVTCESVSEMAIFQLLAPSANLVGGMGAEEVNALSIAH